MSPRPADIATALSLLTRLPVPRADVTRGAAAAWAWPLVGGITGGLGALALTLSGTAGLPSGVSAGLALAAGALVTGALHEDGLADTADGLWGGWTRERRLEIMRDSTIGAYGVVALVFVTGLRWAALAALVPAGHAGAALLTAAVVSRGMMAAVAGALPHARPAGLSVRTGRPGPRTCVLGLALSALLALLLSAGAGLAAWLLAALAASAMGLLARTRIGGQTGDILGATQQLSDLAALLAIAALLA